MPVRQPSCAEFRAEELVSVVTKFGPGAITGSPIKMIHYIPGPALIHGVMLTGGAGIYGGSAEDDEPSVVIYVRDGSTVNLQSDVLRFGWEAWEQIQDYPNGSVGFWLPAVQTQRFFWASQLDSVAFAKQSAEKYWLGSTTNTSRFCNGPRTVVEVAISSSAGATNDGYIEPSSILVCYTRLTQPTPPTPEEIRAYDERAMVALLGHNHFFSGSWPHLPSATGMLPGITYV